MPFHVHLHCFNAIPGEREFRSFLRFQNIRSRVVQIAVGGTDMQPIAKGVFAGQKADLGNLGKFCHMCLRGGHGEGLSLRSREVDPLLHGETLAYCYYMGKHSYRATICTQNADQQLLNLDCDARI